MQAIRQQLLDKGGTLGDWGGLITNWLQPDDQLWTEGKAFPGDVLGQARAIMSMGAILEYECVDNRGREQGLALVRLLDWEDHAQGILKAEHLVASDGYYEWYATQELKEGKGLYHICGSGRGQCSVRLGRGDRRELVHLHKWRVTSPLVMMESAYSKPIALQALQNWVNNFQARVPSPARPPAPPHEGGRGDATGLDKALEAVDKEVEAAEPQRKRAEQARAMEVDKTPKGSVGALLEKKAAERREAMRLKDEERKRHRDRRRSRSRGRRRKRRPGRTSSGGASGSRSCSSGSSHSFRKPSTRGEDELWRQSKRNPGKLLKKTMQELSRYLADRAPGSMEGGDWTELRMMAYVSQVILTQHPPQAMGVRNHRELVTLGRAIDLLLAGQLGELGDLLAQRLKAVETAVAEQSWSTARHQELIPSQAASLTTEGERRRAARQEVAHGKLRELVSKGRRQDK